uniref:Uncharacterized protein n=1 Tax=Anguilla anguilla TaxID=7936 RepID=A0A0E9W0M9_ANGAN
MSFSLFRIKIIRAFLWPECIVYSGSSGLEL